MTRVTARVFFKTIILSLCVLWSAQSALATTVVRPLDDDMIISARAIITGKVLHVESAIDQQDRIFTYITVKVTEVIKGQISERRIVLKEFGGIVGDRASVVYGSALFKRGERVLLYLGTHNDGSLRTYQMFLGKFSIVTDEATGKTFAVRDSGGENVDVLTAQDHAQGDSTDRMELSSYRELVRTRLAGNLARAQEFEETYYRNIPVLATPPGFVSSKKQIHSEYTFLGNVRWFQPDTGQPVPYTINPDPGASTVAPDPNDIAAAAGAWTGVQGCSLFFSYSGILNTCYTQTGTPGVNFVSNNCDGHNQPSSGCANILAIGGWSAGGSQTRVIGGITFGQITQGFVSFNPWASCYFSDHCNFREIATHELGHALGLAHSQDPTATMAAYAHFDGRCASIKTDDVNGIKFLYPGSGGPGPLAVATVALSGGSVGTPYSQTLTGSGGTLPYSWSLVAGQGTLPLGLSLSAAGVIVGTPTTSATSNFTVRVTDAAQATAQKALSIVVTAAGAGPFASQFVSQTVPTTLQPGQTFSSNLKFLNTGTQPWTGSLFYLASQNPTLNQTWGGNAVSLVAFAVAPGQQLDVSFDAVAPLTPGTYNFQWQMYMNDGTGFFGQMSTNVVIQVGAAPPVLKTSFDFTGDGKSDISVYRSQTGQWLLLNSSTGQGTVQNWGFPSLQDKPVPGDYDGDGKADLAVYRSLTGQWLITNSSNGQVTVQSWGYPSLLDVPVPADYDGDGKTDLAVYRSTTGQWLILKSSTGQGIVQNWGFPSLQDQPVSGDYDGDGKADVAVYRGLTGQWFILKSSNGQSLVQSWGYPSLQDKPVPADYDGDGKTDLAVYRAATGQWLILKSSTGQSTVQAWGYPSLGDMPISADYDGDGKADIAVYRGSTGQWFVLKSTTGQSTVTSWGFPSLSDIPLPSVYIK